jgi:hypothetical protein
MQPQPLASSRPPPAATRPRLSDFSQARLLEVLQQRPHDSVFEIAADIITMRGAFARDPVQPLIDTLATRLAHLRRGQVDAFQQMRRLLPITRSDQDIATFLQALRDLTEQYEHAPLPPEF